MAEIKWIKLSVNMFDDEKIRLIQSMPESDAIIIVWIRLLTLAGKTNNEGQIYISENMPYSEEMLAQLFDKPVNIIRLAIDTLKKFEMIQIVGNDVIFISNWEKHQNIEGMEKIKIQNAERAKRYREKKKQLQSRDVTLSVTKRHGTDIDKEIDKDKELDIEKDIYSRAALDITPSTPESSHSDKETSNHDNAPYKEIIDYLNEKADRDFKPSTKATKTKIKARLNEGFTLDDFKKVIDVKVAEWLNDKEYDKYLCPDTLFGPKFEKYLNQKKVKSQGYTRDYDISIPDDLLPF